MSVQVERRPFNVDDYYRMAEAGILTEDDRVELIEGEVIKMSPIGSRHAACVDRLNSLLSLFAGQTAIVRVQNPIRIDDYSEPQPDVSLLKPRADFYAESHPTPADILLVIEVADTSVEYDRHVKVPLYAQAGIPEVWLVNLSEDLIEIYTVAADGSYKNIRRVKRGESLSLQAIPDMTFSVDAVLG
jgi:Uma2 family endonuclease